MIFDDAYQAPDCRGQFVMYRIGSVRIGMRLSQVIMRLMVNGKQ